MFKLVVLSALVAVAVAKPGFYGAIEVATPILSKTYIAPAAVSSTWREDVISKPAFYAAAPVVAKTIVAEPLAVASPVVAKSIVAPVAVSHTYRKDVISKPAAVGYAAVPAVAYAAPIVQKTVDYAPVAYSAPVVAKTIVAPSVYRYGAHAPAVHAW